MLLTIITTLLITYQLFSVDIHNYFLSKHVIFWKKNVEINFSDYEANPDFKSNHNASFFHGLYLSTNNIKDATVRAFFDKERSWIKDTTDVDVEKSKKLQKLRFDLYEAFARKFNKEIDIVRYSETKKFDDLNTIGNRIYEELQIVEDQIYSSISIEEAHKIYRPKVDSLLNLYQ